MRIARRAADVPLTLVAVGAPLVAGAYGFWVLHARGPAALTVYMIYCFLMFGLGWASSVAKSKIR